VHNCPLSTPVFVGYPEYMNVSEPLEGNPAIIALARVIVDSAIDALSQVAESTPLPR
jgi:hypothetical protein